MMIMTLTLFILGMAFQLFCLKRAIEMPCPQGDASFKIGVVKMIGIGIVAPVAVWAVVILITRGM
jgi:hypothetical protein